MYIYLRVNLISVAIEIWEKKLKYVRRIKYALDKGFPTLSPWKRPPPSEFNLSISMRNTDKKKKKWMERFIRAANIALSIDRVKL